MIYPFQDPLQNLERERRVFHNALLSSEDTGIDPVDP
jgi:hypothetical protein